MAVTATCPNGHVLKVKDEYAGKSGLCPHCHARVFVPMPIHANEKARISDDEIMGLLGEPRKVAPEPGPSPADHVLDSGKKEAGQAESAISLLGSSVLRKQKICPQCSYAASPAFTHCPRCGTPLPEIDKSKK
jgi:uncharacterized paraquat-inducible protein A